mgnify:CR=1 FL=1
MVEEYKYKEITGKIIGVAMQVHKVLENVHLAQAINYLEAYNIEVGLLINFGSKSLEFKRLINTKYQKSEPGC